MVFFTSILLLFPLNYYYIFYALKKLKIIIFKICYVIGMLISILINSIPIMSVIKFNQIT
uniref:Uncharacterized protein n=1 Tax=Myoviridae sp. cteo515 TaxID=2823550 RepID=A0A8S5LBG7_9CAUD|nr:MAG TPA: hypothetical protein [Myoviridae sp. cteo515]